jgi:hypothetical protein
VRTALRQPPKGGERKGIRGGRNCLLAQQGALRGVKSTVSLVKLNGCPLGDDLV